MGAVGNQKVAKTEIHRTVIADTKIGLRAETACYCRLAINYAALALQSCLTPQTWKVNKYRLEHAQVNADIAKKLVEACAKFCWELGVEPRVLQWEVESLSWVSSWVQLYWGPEAMLGLIVNPVNSIVWGGPIFAGGTLWNPDNPAPDAGLRGCGTTRPAMAELYKKKGWKLRFTEQLGCKLGDRLMA